MIALSVPALALAMYDFWRWRVHLSQSQSEGLVTVGSPARTARNPIPTFSARESQTVAAQDGGVSSGMSPAAMKLGTRSRELVVGSDLPLTQSCLPASRFDGLVIENLAARHSHFPSSPPPIWHGDVFPLHIFSTFLRDAVCLQPDGTSLSRTSDFVVSAIDWFHCVALFFTTFVGFTVITGKRWFMKRCALIAVGSRK